MTESQQQTESKGILIIVAGPTASGKSDLALKLAKEYSAEIFSADSRQIYKEMTIGTAKPDAATLAKVPHHFINHISIRDSYSAGRFEKEILERLETYFKSNAVAILCGGTGLYIRAVMEGLDQFPEVTQEVLDDLNAMYTIKGIEPLQDALSLADPDYYKVVDTQNPMRLIRALAVTRSSGKPYSTYLSNVVEQQRNFHTICILLDLPRHELYDKINKRVDLMVAQGLEAEAQSLYSLQSLKALNTVGYSEWFHHFEGATNKDTTIELIKRNSRRYAKRQITWFNKYGNWEKFHPAATEDILAFVHNECIRFGRG